MTKHKFPITVVLRTDWSKASGRGTFYETYFDTSGKKKKPLPELTLRYDFYAFSKNDKAAIQRAEAMVQKAQTDVNEKGPQFEAWKRDFFAYYDKIAAEDKKGETQTSYKTVRNHFRRYRTMKNKKPDSLLFQDLDEFVIKEIKQYFENNVKSPNSRHLYLSKILHVVGKAGKHGLLRHYIDIDQFEIVPSKRKEKIAVEQLQSLLLISIEHEKHEEIIRAFLWNHFVGLRFGDLQNVSYAHIVRSVTDEFIIDMITGKRKVRIRNHIRPDIFNLLVKPGTVEQRLFPGLSSINVGTFNKTINRWLEKVGVEMYLTSHSSRVFYGNAIFQHTKSLELTDKALGHKMKSVSLKHYVDIGDEDLREATLMMYLPITITVNHNKAV